MKPDTTLIQKLLDKIARTRDDEIDCQEVFELLDIYAEAAAQGQDAGAMLPLVKHHLEMCVECLEEYQALLLILEAGDET
ncbi:MAG: hypothetical protein PVF49_05135 [Anaerolineales bacterium]|jgi:DNA-binding FrmR family transcriptional regulator